MTQSIPPLSRPRLSADRLALAASLCALTGAGVFFLVLLCDYLPLRAGIAVWICDGGFLVFLGLAFLAAPLIGLVTCVQLCRQRSVFADLNDIDVLRRARRRFGRAALLFAVESLLVLLACPSGGADIDNPLLTRLADLWVLVPSVLAVVLGIASFRLATRSQERGVARVGSTIAATMGLGTIILPWSIMAILFLISYREYSAGSPSFCGDSNSLSRTVVVPTLDSPMPPGKNVVWCSSFQLAWNALRDDFLHEAVRLSGGQELADRLNAAQLSRDDLDPLPHFVMTGRGEEVRERIATEMARQFPGVSAPRYEGLSPDGYTMFAYLEAQAKFEHPFEDDHDGMRFTDSAGRRTTVASFGVWDDSDCYEKVRDQVRVLWSLFSEPDPNRDLQDANDWVETYLERQEFAIDLCRYTEPCQIILAKIEPKATLALTVADLNDKMAAFSQSEDFESLQELSEDDDLRVPEMFWEISHRFTELQGQTLANPAYAGSPIERAEQMIHFRLDRCGAILKSRAAMVVTLGISRARTFAFDRPFLICMKKRDAERPFFVMWVDNAELLTRK